jgi:hypothetical protein
MKCKNVDSCHYNKMCVYVKHFRFFENLFKCIDVASCYSRSYTVLLNIFPFLIKLFLSVKKAVLCI